MNKKDFDEKVFHDTKLLLEHYRDVVWSLEVETFQTSINFQKEYGTTLEDFLDMTYKAGMEISESDVASRIESMNKSRNMLKIIDRAMELLQMKHQDGEWYYWILYLTYLAPKNCLPQRIFCMNWKSRKYLFPEHRIIGFGIGRFRSWAGYYGVTQQNQRMRS